MPTLRPAPSRSILLALATTLALGTAPFAFAQEGNVEIETVTLATGGLASIQGTMSAPGTTMRLPVEREHVSDVLRTLVVTGDAAVAAIDLEAAESLDSRTVAGRLGAGQLSDPAALLDELIGEEVEIAAGTVRLAGRLLAYERIDLPASGEGDPVPALRISVATPEGRIAFASVPLGDPIAIEGGAVDAALSALLPGLAEANDDTRRTLLVSLGSEGQAGFRFVIPSTVWRPSYRATIGEEGAVDLQGWATLENTTGFDWNAVRLRLAVGTPVAYAQDVYSPLRTERPDASFAVGQTAEAPIVQAAPRERMERFAAADMAMEAAPGMAMEAAPGTALTAAAPLQTGEAVSERSLSVFDVPAPVTLDAGRALSVPFLDASVEAERVAFLDLTTGRDPLDALELRFTEDSTVPGGLIAVYGANGFVGDARFDGASGGEERILPFAVSDGIDVTASERSSRRVTEVSLADGVLRVTRRITRGNVLDVSAAEPTVLVVEGARGNGETVQVRMRGEAATGAPEAVPVDSNRYRTRIDLPEGRSSVSISVSRPVAERYAVSDVPTPVLQEVLSLGDTVPESTRRVLARLAQTAATIADLRRQEAAANQEIEELREALASDRENLRAIGPATPEGALIRTRIVERANAVDALLGELRALRAQRLEAERALREG